MKIGLVVTSRGRIDVLERLFESLRLQSDVGSIRVVVVKQGAWIWNPPSFRGEVVVVSSELCSLSMARNLGIEHLGNGVDVVGFPDDDCWYPPEICRQVLGWFGFHSGVSALAVRVYDPLRKVPYGRRPTTRVDVGYHNVFKLPISVGIFVRCKALKKVGRFNVRLGVGTDAGSGEETEIIARILATGERVVYDGSMEVFHEVGSTGGSSFWKEFRYGRGCGITHQLLMHRSMYGVFWSFLDLWFRSIGGSIKSILKWNSFAAYMGRCGGLMFGLLLGGSNDSGEPRRIL